MKHVVTLSAALLLASCAATSEPGWTGSGAEPFDAAQAACRTATERVDPALREHEFQRCMAERGWRRP